MQHLNTKIDTLTQFKAEIIDNKYSVRDVISSIDTWVESLGKLKTGLQYEIDANADHKTSEQFNGKV